MNLKRLKFGTVLVAALALAVVMVACAKPAPTGGPPWQGKVNWEQVVANAKKEGKVVTYGDLPDNVLSEVRKHFKELYGDIAIEQITGRSAEQLARIEAEQKSKTYVADIFAKSLTSAWTAKRAGYIEKVDYQNILPALKEKGAVWDRPIRVDPGGYFLLGYAQGQQGIGINTKLVPPDKEPKTWDDLLDPYWKGKMLQDLPVGPRAGGTTYLAWKLYKGDAWLDKMVAQKTTITTQGSAARARMVARGEYPLEFPATSGEYTMMPPGTPVKWIFPADGVVALGDTISILKGAPHPNAALLFANFMLTKQGQTDLALGGQSVARGDVPLPNPEFQKIKGKKFWEFEEEWYVTNSDTLWEKDAKKRWDIK